MAELRAAQVTVLQGTINLNIKVLTSVRHKLHVLQGTIYLSIRVLNFAAQVTNKQRHNYRAQVSCA